MELGLDKFLLSLETFEQKNVVEVYKQCRSKKFIILNPVKLAQCILHSPFREKKSENFPFSDCTRFSILNASFETFSALGLLPIPD